MPIIKLDIPAGVYSHGTPLESKGRWIDANLVRWTNGAPQPIGGWVSLGVTIAASTEGIMRGSHSWVSNGGAPYVAFGSASKLYIVTGTNTAYDITPASFTTGIAEAGQNTGYGGGAYGNGAYGVPREINYTVSPATNWTLDNWGQNLIGCSDADGKIYELVMDDGAGGGFINDNTVNATVVTNAPTTCRSMIVTAERFVFAFGDGTPRTIKWCDKEDNTTWTPAVTNEAGDFELQTNGVIVCAERVRGRTLILTTQDAWTAAYQGPPLVYGFQKIGESCGVAGRNLSASVGPTAFWMGERNFFVYDGSTARVLPCEVHDKVFTEMNTDRISHGFCVPNTKFNEVWWFYPGMADDENTRYVAYDYHENHWTIGELSRTAGVDSGAFKEPLLITEAGVIYRHETGFGHGGTKPYLTSGPINIADGDNVMRATELIPEEETQGQMALTFTTRFYPNGTEYTHGPYDPANPTSVRFTGRQMSMKIEADDGANWRFGDVRLRITGGGRR
jgi:hypothetical protein